MPTTYAFTHSDAQARQPEAPPPGDLTGDWSHAGTKKTKATNSLSRPAASMYDMSRRWSQNRMVEERGAARRCASASAAITLNQSPRWREGAYLPAPKCRTRAKQMLPEVRQDDPRAAEAILNIL